MDIINQFLKEDMLITRPSVFIYIDNKDRDKVINNGIHLGTGSIDAYLTRLPEDCDTYKEFLSTHTPIRLTLSKLRKIKSQVIRLIPRHMDEALKIDLKDDASLDKLIKRYGEYLTTCYKDKIPLDRIPHIEMHFSGSFIPGFVCKVLDT